MVQLVQPMTMLSLNLSHLPAFPQQAHMTPSHTTWTQITSQPPPLSPTQPVALLSSHGQPRWHPAWSCNGQSLRPRTSCHSWTWGTATLICAPISMALIYSEEHLTLLTLSHWITLLSEHDMLLRPRLCPSHSMHTTHWLPELLQLLQHAPCLLLSPIKCSSLYSLHVSLVSCH
jgi:hypothetical protein